MPRTAGGRGEHGEEPDHALGRGLEPGEAEPQLAPGVEDAVPYGDEGQGEHVLGEARLGVQERERSVAAKHQVARERRRARRDQRRPQRRGGEPVAGHEAACTRLGLGVRPRAVEEQNQHRHQEQHPRDPRQRRQPAQGAGGRPAPAPRRVEGPGREREEQRLGVDGGEEQGQGPERDQLDRHVGHARPELERREPVDDEQTTEQRQHRDEHAGDRRRTREPGAGVDEQRIEGKESRRGRRRVTVVGDPQVPNRVAPHGGRGEHVAHASERGGDSRDVEALDHARLGAEQAHGEAAGDPDQEP